MASAFSIVLVLIVALDRPVLPFSTVNQAAMIDLQEDLRQLRE
jgi:hypothetical protein